MAVNFELKKTYNFNIKSDATSILGDQYTLMKVMAILSSTEAVKYSDIATTFEQLKPIIDDLPTSLSDLTFILFEDSDGEESVYALEYIDIDTIVLVESVNVQARVYGVSSEDLSIIRTRLAELGYSNIDVKTFE